MTHKTKLAALIAALTFAGTSAAAAQTQAPKPIFVDVNGGAQTQSRTLNTTTSFPLYGETAVINSAQGIDGGGLFDISGGYRIYRQLSVGVGFSAFSKTGSGTIAAAIPNPAVVNRPATSTTSGTGLKHRELGTHLLFIWTQPIRKNFEAAIFGGPSFIRLTQDVMTALVPAGTQTVNVTSESQQATAKGGNVGVNLNYLVRPNYGAGVFIRYAGGTAKLAAGSAKVGGLQLGGGLRLRF